MKSFLDLVQEAKSDEVHHVMTFGRMNPPTTGHLKLIDKVKDVAKKNNAGHTVVTSHSQDAKKNPLSATQKLKHLKRYSPDTHFEASSKEHPTFLHHAAKIHKKGVTHLHMVVGSDRVKEMKEKLHRYNGTHEGALYNFKKITVHSAGERDPDAEGDTGMSGTKMREHAKNKDIKSFRQGVPHHVSDTHAKELMHDTRKGMGLHEDIYRGVFKAIFVTGGPGSGKDVVIREAIAEERAVEINSVQAFDYLADKQKLSERTNDIRREAIRTRAPLIINGPADDAQRMIYVKEELEDLGYETMMVFVNTTDEVSKERNEKLKRTISESMRHDKWVQSQNLKESYHQNFEYFMHFDNDGSYEQIEEDVTDAYQSINHFFDKKLYNDVAFSWLENRGKISSVNSNLFKEEKNVSKNSKSIQTKTARGYNPAYRAAGPSDIPPDNDKSGGGAPDDIKFDKVKRTGSYTFRTYSESRSDNNSNRSYGTAPTLEAGKKAKESRFQQDNDKEKRLKRGDTSLKAARVGRPDGVGSTINTRGYDGLTGGAGLGDATYKEEVKPKLIKKDRIGQEYSTSNRPTGDTAGPRPSNNFVGESFKSFIKEYNGFINDVESGVGGTLGGASNKENMDSYKDPMRNVTTEIKVKKKKKLKEGHVSELEKGLQKLNSHNYETINNLMMKISKEHNISGKQLHNDFTSEHGKTPDDWIKEKK
jgi:hypothetical protein